MFKMEIALNEEKILRDGIYSPADISSRIDKLFQHYHIEKQGDGLYVGGDWADHGVTIMYLNDKAWFMPYVEKWLWYKSKGTTISDGFVVEDLAAHYKKKGLIAS